MKVYHYTSLLHLEAIQDQGWLRTTESNCSLLKPHAGPDVVWFTTDPNVTVASIFETGKTLPSGLVLGRHGLSPHKAQVRLELSVPKTFLRQWLSWAPKHGLSDDDRRILIGVGGSRSWYVATQRIPISMIQDVTLDASFQAV